MIKKEKAKKLAWWIGFSDRTIKKVFSSSMGSAWKKGELLGKKLSKNKDVFPISIAGNKHLVEKNIQPMPLGKSKEEQKGADPSHLIGLLEWLSDPWKNDPNGDPTTLVSTMAHKAKEALTIVQGFPVVYVEEE